MKKNEYKYESKAKEKVHRETHFPKLMDKNNSAKNLEAWMEGSK